ncbi:lipase family protein [Dietzia alimentaria]|uniref:lipase family protein n=1 Tax=Dietzia alimentaria TaxID=665550 RepID=UPI000498355B|nr:lipase family protein [Dietzia alimentaria]
MRAGVFAAAIATIAASAFIAPAAHAQGSSNDPAPAFYQPPAELPSDAGVFIKSEAFPLAAAIPPIPGAENISNGAGALSTDAQRIMYTSVGSRGQKVAVTGAYLQPRIAWTGPGTRPLAVVAPGTQGQGDHCAPSKTFQNLATIRTDPPGVGFGYELLQAYALLDRGYAVAMTDYEGLGTPGLHSYVDRESQARAVLDIARAASAVPGADVGDTPRTVLTGYSQGGGAVAAAAELQPQYAPDVNLVGTAAGSPPADLLATLEQIDGTAISGVIGYALNSLLDANPEMGPLLDPHFNDLGRQMLATTSDQCIAETALQFFQQRTNQYTNTGESAGAIVRKDPQIYKFLEQQRIGKLTPTSPVRILSPINDDVVPGPQSQQLGRDWCAQGAAVDMVIDPTPPIVPGLVINHAVPMISGLQSTVQYLDDRINGLPAPSNCGTY